MPCSPSGGSQNRYPFCSPLLARQNEISVDIEWRERYPGLGFEIFPFFPISTLRTKASVPFRIVCVCRIIDNKQFCLLVLLPVFRFGGSVSNIILFFSVMLYYLASVLKFVFIDVFSCEYKARDYICIHFFILLYIFRRPATLVTQKIQLWALDQDHDPHPPQLRFPKIPY